MFNGRFDEAIELYTKALHEVKADDLERKATLLSNRAAAFAR